MGQFIRWSLAVAVVASSAVSLRAEDAATDNLYGEGVHAYFAGKLDEALAHLDASVAAGNRDPRCYYYRGLVSLKLGKTDAAKTDFSEGAKLEAQHPETTTLINRSIQRVQGSTRLTIEKFRSDAQVAALAARKERELARYGAARASAIEELKKQAEAQQGNAQLLPDAGAATDPLDAGPVDAGPAAVDPADAVTEESDPFRDEAETTDPNAAADPSTDPTADPADEVPDVVAPDEVAPPEEMPAEEAPADADATDPAASEDAPAAEEAPATDEPAVEEPAVEEPATDEPAAEEPGDLFGEEPAAP